MWVRESMRGRGRGGQEGGGRERGRAGVWSLIRPGTSNKAPRQKTSPSFKIDLWIRYHPMVIFIPSIFFGLGYPYSVTLRALLFRHASVTRG